MQKIHHVSIRKGKGNVDLYSASSRTPLSLTRSDMDHKLLPANITISALTRKHSPRRRRTRISIANAWVQLTTHLSTQEDEWLSWPCWLTSSRRFNPRRSPVNCTSRLRQGKVRRVIDRHSNHCSTYHITYQITTVTLIVIGNSRNLRVFNFAILLQLRNTDAHEIYAF